MGDHRSMDIRSLGHRHLYQPRAEPFDRVFLCSLFRHDAESVCDVREKPCLLVT